MRKSLRTLTEEFRSEPTTPWYDKNEEGWPKIIRKPTLVYRVTKQQHSPDDRQPQGYVKVNCSPVGMLDLRRLKEAVISYGMYSPYVKWMLNSWATWNRSMSQD